MKFITCFLSRFAAISAICFYSLPSFACTVPLPNPGPSNEYEIEVEMEDYDSSTNMLTYKVEIEVEVFSPLQTSAQCQCGLNLGSNTSTAPASFDVINAAVGLRGSQDVDFAPFSGFSQDSNVESDLAALSAFNEGASAFGFSLDVSPFDAPVLNPGDTVALVFEIQFSLDDFDTVNGSPIQFAAGSSDASHPLNIFSGYQASLQLPQLPSQEGDFNYDQNVDEDDFSVWEENFGVVGSASVVDGDADGDGTVDGNDFLIWQSNFGTLRPENTAAVPEPSTFALLAMVVAAGCVFVRRNKRLAS